MEERGVIAAVLAGGLGTRLRSALPGRPKVLAPVNGRPHIERLLEQIAAAGIRHAVLLVGHLADQVRGALGDEACGIRLSYSSEPTPLGTGGAVRNALPLLGGRSVLLLNGDSHCAIDLATFVRWHAHLKGEASMVLASVEDSGRYGQVEADRGRIVRFAEKAAGAGPGWINAGIYLIEPHLIEAMPAGASSLERDVFPAWVRERRVLAYQSSAAFLDIGTPESFARAERHFAALATLRPAC